MSDASLPLQAAILAALKADAGVIALVNAKSIYDTPPAGALKPYLSFGPVQLIPEHSDEYVGGDTALQLDAWSAGPSSVEIKRIGPDGLTKHAAIACRARTEPTA
jgi:hypothetical protein